MELGSLAEQMTELLTVKKGDKARNEMNWIVISGENINKC